MRNPMTVFETERLVVSHFTLDDASFVLELQSEPDWLRFIGDRGVRDLDSARAYIQRAPLDMYARLGFGLYKVSLKADGAPIGMCGLLKRDSLPDADIGFAFLARHRGKGYAREAAQATLDDARKSHGLKRILAITSPDNVRSIGLLEKLGFTYQKTLQLSADGGESRLFALDQAG
jgi:ribosomal-protein-alanine N-acetyltransferase